MTPGEPPEVKKTETSNNAEMPTEDAVALTPAEFEQMTKDKLNKAAGKKPQTIEEKIGKQEEKLTESREEYYNKIKAETNRLKKVEIVEMKKATYLLRELPFFKLEAYILLVVSFMGAGLILFSFLGLVDPIVNLVAYGTMVLTAWGIWILKKILYMPNKNKFPVLKIFSSGLATLVCEKITDRKVWFNKNIAPTVITNYRAMTDMFTGYPLILAFEGYFENLDLPGMMKGKADLNKSERLKSALDEAIEQGVRKERIKQKSVKTGLINNPLFWISIATLVIVGFYVMQIGIPQAGMMEDMKDTLDSINTNIGTMTEALTKGAPDNVTITPGGA